MVARHRAQPDKCSLQVFYTWPAPFIAFSVYPRFVPPCSPSPACPFIHLFIDFCSCTGPPHPSQAGVQDLLWFRAARPRLIFLVVAPAVSWKPINDYEWWALFLVVSMSVLSGLFLSMFGFFYHLLFLSSQFGTSLIRQPCWNKRSHTPSYLYWLVWLTRLASPRYFPCHLLVRFVSLYVLVYGFCGNPTKIFIYWRGPWPDSLKEADGLFPRTLTFPPASPCPISLGTKKQF